MPEHKSFLSKHTKITTKRKIWTIPFLLESPRSKDFQPPDLEINFLMDSGAESNITQAELRLSTLMRECTVIIYTLTEYEFLILGSKHSTVLFTDHKPIIFLFIQKSNTIHRVYRFQLILMKFRNLHIGWTAGKNLALPDTLSRNTRLDLLTRKTTVEIPQNIKFYLAKR